MSFKSGKEGQSEEEEIAHLTKTDALTWKAGGLNGSYMYN